MTSTLLVWGRGGSRRRRRTEEQNSPEGPEVVLKEARLDVVEFTGGEEVVFGNFGGLWRNESMLVTSSANGSGCREMKAILWTFFICQKTVRPSWDVLCTAAQYLKYYRLLWVIYSASNIYDNISIWGLNHIESKPPQHFLWVLLFWLYFDHPDIMRGSRDIFDLSS